MVLQRTLLPGWQLQQLRRQAARLLFDFDDAIFLRDSYAQKGLHHAGRLRRFISTVRVCEAVIAGNAFLADHASLYADPTRVVVVPTCVDEQRYPVRSETAGSRDGKELVWIGSSSTLQGIERIAPLLEQLGQAIPGLRLRVICDRFPRFQHLPVICRPWSEATEVAELLQADLGISWIPDDLWSRGKCGLKLLQYMAAGLPVVANPVGMHLQIVRHGETGWLVHSAEDWLCAVRRLVGDASLRARMGQAGRRQLQTEYSISCAAKTWLTLLGELLLAPVGERGHE